MRSGCSCVGILAAGLLFLPAGSAQDPRGSILGRVEDQSGALVPGVAIRVKNAATGVTASATANQAGSFQIPFLLPGAYQVEAELAGFKKFRRDGIEVRVGDAVELVLTMQVGAVTETVEVTAETPLLETATSSLGQVIDQRRILELPQRGGNPMELALLAPGIVNGTNLRLRKSSAPDATSNISADGTNTYNTEFQIDGISNTTNDTGRGQPRMAFSPPPTAVREFKVDTSPYDASIGHSIGSVVNISTASGTNQLHGEAHYWAKNSAFDAPNFFNNKAGTKKTVYQDNRYGASAGGPVYLPKLYDGQNRTFWYHAWEANRWGVPLTYTNTVPTAAQREGDFSGLLSIPNGSRYQIYNPFTTRAAPGGRFQRDPLPNNVIPRSLLDPVGVKMAAFWPLPTSAGTADGRNNFFRVGPARQSYSSHMTRLDHAFSERHRVFFRMHYAFFENKGQRDRLGNGTTHVIINQIKRGLALDDVIVVGTGTVLNIRYGLTNAEFLERRGSRGFDLSSLGFSPALLALTDKDLATIPRISAGAYTLISDWQDGDGGNTALTHNLVGTLTHLRGRHNLKAGADARVYRTSGNRFPRKISPDFQFSNTYTRGPLDNSTAAAVGQELASMLLGIPGGSMAYSGSYALQDTFLGLYLHDDLKLSPRLTVNLGLRYEIEWPLTERFNRLVAEFDGTAPNPIEAQARANYARSPIPELAVSDFRVPGGLTWVAQGGRGRSPYRGEKNNIMPRVGLAFQWTPATVVRGGYGIFYDTIGVSRAAAIQTGFSQSTPIQASKDNGLTYIARNANPLPNGLMLPLGPAGGMTTNLGQDIDFYNPALTHPYSQRWSLGVQRMLPARFVAEATYVGNRSTRLTLDRQINNLPAKYLSTLPVRDQKTIDYLSAQFSNPFAGAAPIYGARTSRSSLLRPFPEFGNVVLEDPVGYSWYHSLQVRSEKRFSRGYTFQVNYTFSKLMAAAGFLNATDPLPYESIAALDRPHRLAMSGIWEIPVGRGRAFGRSLPKAADFVLGGWQLTGVVIRQAGQALSFGNIIFNGNIKDIPLPKSLRSADRWFNTGAGFNRNITEQLASNIRTFPLSLSGLRGDGQASWDLSVLKAFPIRERLKAEFRAECYNAWNHTNLNNPNMSPTSTAFGTITGTSGDARNWQFALKLVF